jgi:hypothetical protein
VIGPDGEINSNDISAVESIRKFIEIKISGIEILRRSNFEKD